MASPTIAFKLIAALRHCDSVCLIKAGRIILLLSRIGGQVVSSQMRARTSTCLIVSVDKDISPSQQQWRVCGGVQSLMVEYHIGFINRQTSLRPVGLGIF